MRHDPTRVGRILGDGALNDFRPLSFHKTVGWIGASTGDSSLNSCSKALDTICDTLSPVVSESRLIFLTVSSGRLTVNLSNASLLGLSMIHHTFKHMTYNCIRLPRAGSVRNIWHRQRRSPPKQSRFSIPTNELEPIRLNCAPIDL
jgi:hypothetical protein